MLARDHLGLVDGESTTFPGGAAVRRGPRGAVLIEDTPARALGPALAWAQRHGVDELHVLVEDAAGQVARQASCFTVPPTVWWVQDRALHPVTAEPTVVPPWPTEAALEVATQDFAGLCDPGREHDTVIGEVLGLEVARVVEAPGAALRVEVGIGPHDREAFALIHGDRPPVDALAGVVEYVRAHRRPSGPDHALRRISPERWLRNIVIDRPPLAGAAQIGTGQAAMVRPNVRDVWPAVAWGDDAEGGRVCIVCSVGVDLDLVPFAADARLVATGGDSSRARLVLVLPERDALPITRSLAALLREPAEVVTVPDDWRSLDGTAAGAPAP